MIAVITSPGIPSDKSGISVAPATPLLPASAAASVNRPMVPRCPLSRTTPATTGGRAALAGVVPVLVVAVVDIRHVLVARIVLVRLDLGEGHGLAVGFDLRLGLGLFQAGGIDDAEFEVEQPRRALAAVAGDARDIVDNGQPLSGQAVKKGRFPDIGKPDDAYGKSH